MPSKLSSCETNQTDHALALRKLELAKKILSKQAQIGILRRVVSRSSNRDEINKCKEILNENFQILQASRVSFNRGSSSTYP
jgi:hypothetical protein